MAQFQLIIDIRVPIVFHIIKMVSQGDVYKMGTFSSVSKLKVEHKMSVVPT